VQVRKLQADESVPWSRVGDQQIFVGDLIDEAAEPEARMTVGFARVAEGEALEITFPYDEVLIVTRGAYRVRTEAGEVVTARPGDVVYLPAGSVSSSRADEDTEMVYVANPPDVYAAHVAASAAG
jgi:ethanolamine utilization protein EutQ (cupin superfamily)